MHSTSFKPLPFSTRLLLKIQLYLNRILKKQSKEKWDRDYENGVWTSLSGEGEVERFNAVLSAIQTYAHRGEILEIGCGEGILRSRMSHGTFSAYTGIDISEVAIRKAIYLNHGSSQFICANMEGYQPGSTYDLIIFNESLYYAQNPLSTLERYARFLKPGGHIVTSIHQTKMSIYILHTILAKFPSKAQQHTSHGNKVWHCHVFVKESILTELAGL